MSLELELSTVDSLVIVGEVDKVIIAKTFVEILNKYNVMWHFDDNIDDIEWSHDKPSPMALDLMEKLRDDLYDHDLCKYAVEILQSEK